MLFHPHTGQMKLWNAIFVEPFRLMCPQQYGFAVISQLLPSQSFRSTISARSIAPSVLIRPSRIADTFHKELQVKWIIVISIEFRHIQVWLYLRRPAQCALLETAFRKSCTSELRMIIFTASLAVHYHWWWYQKCKTKQMMTKKQERKAERFAGIIF